MGQHTVDVADELIGSVAALLVDGSGRPCAGRGKFGGVQAGLRQQLATSDQQRDLAGDGHPPRLVHRHEVLLGQPLETGSHRDGGGAPGAGRQHCARVGRCQFQPVVEGPRVRNSQPDTGLVGAHDCLQATGFGAHDLADGRRYADIAVEVSPQ